MIERMQASRRRKGFVSDGSRIYVAGLRAERPRGKTVAEQAREVFGKIDAVLAQAGSDRSKVLSANVWLADIGEVEALNAEWNAWIPSGLPPARATVEAKLPGRHTVEVAVIAAV